MGVLPPYHRRHEPRKPLDLPLMVWGVDIQECASCRRLTLRDISLSGALLAGLDADLKSGDVIGILYGKNKARYRVVWVRYDEMGDKMQAAVHRLESDACPWLDLLTEDAPQTSPPTVAHC